MNVKRSLGRSGIAVSALGLGTARIGGLGYSRAGDRETRLVPEAVDESKRAVRRALDLGVTFFDTADVYGAGRSERILGEAIAGHRREVTLATKFGERFDEETGEEVDAEVTPEYVVRACDESLRRLGTDVIDVYLLHLRDFPLDRAAAIRDTLEDLVTAGKIRGYGWSTDDVERAALFAEGRHCIAIEHRLNVLMNTSEMLALCDAHDLASINRVPLLCGAITGRWSPDVTLPASDRRSDWLAEPGFRDMIRRAESLRPILTDGGRSFVQGALGWIWARSPRAIPIPGFRTVEQVEELAGAMAYGPLCADAMSAIEERLGSP
ncbi:aldo/keto reductase [Candidatus Bipolaricaulota bacterium]|nr:aldo/keto reductase [Candidatus Bipolaricaulota bacterium]